jgi:hypothetical protein
MILSEFGIFDAAALLDYVLKIRTVFTVRHGGGNGGEL